jgi:hypothetical protein
MWHTVYKQEGRKPTFVKCEQGTHYPPHGECLICRDEQRIAELEAELAGALKQRVADKTTDDGIEELARGLPDPVEECVRLEKRIAELEADNKTLVELIRRIHEWHSGVGEKYCEIYPDICARLEG